MTEGRNFDFGPQSLGAFKNISFKKISEELYYIQKGNYKLIQLKYKNAF